MYTMNHLEDFRKKKTHPITYSSSRRVLVGPKLYKRGSPANPVKPCAQLRTVFISVLF